MATKKKTIRKKRSNRPESNPKERSNRQASIPKALNDDIAKIQQYFGDNNYSQAVQKSTRAGINLFKQNREAFRELLSV